MSFFKGFALVISAANIFILTPILFSVIWYERFGPNQVSKGLLVYILTSIWLLHTPNAGRNMLFQCFSCKKLKKQERASKWRQNIFPKSPPAIVCQPAFNLVSLFFALFYFFPHCDRKRCKNPHNIILTSIQCGKHLFTG